MNVFEIIAAVYVIGLALTLPLVLKAARRKWEDDLLARKMVPGTEMGILVITYLITPLIWPVIAPMFAYELARERRGPPR